MWAWSGRMPSSSARASAWRQWATASLTWGGSRCAAVLWLAELARSQGRSQSKGCRLTLHSAGPMRTRQRGQVSGDKWAEDKRSSYVLRWYVHENRRGSVALESHAEEMDRWSAAQH